ncbi:MAG: CoA activase [Bacteroidetes bacterium]|nr:CoA activase [Bacteroidota bacterium]
MISIGIDAGAKFIKAIVLKDEKIVAKGQILAGFEGKENVEKIYNRVMNEAGISPGDVNSVTSTGSGRKMVDFATNSVTDVTAAAKGALSLFPGVRTVIDVGAEEGRSIRCDNNGKIIDYAVNEKCAAGAGAFTESMARALEMSLEEFGSLSLKSEKEIPMNAQCAVFAESEVVSLLHAKTPKADIAKAVNDAVASRITSMVRKVGFEKEIALIGGVAYNVGFVKSIETDLKDKIIIPEYPEYVSAYGAALLIK